MVDHEQRRKRPQPSCTKRVAAAWGRLLRSHSSTMPRHCLFRGALYLAGPTAIATQPPGRSRRAARTLFKGKLIRHAGAQLRNRSTLPGPLPAGSLHRLRSACLRFMRRESTSIAVTPEAASAPWSCS